MSASLVLFCRPLRSNPAPAGWDLRSADGRRVREPVHDGRGWEKINVHPLPFQFTTLARLVYTQPLTQTVE